MEEEIKQLKKRVEELEKRPQYIPVYPPHYITPMLPMIPQNPNLHWHNGTPCYNKRSLMRSLLNMLVKESHKRSENTHNMRK